MNLYESYVKSLQAINDVSCNCYHELLRNAVLEISNANDEDDVIAKYCRTLKRKISGRYSAYDPIITSEFAQILGEAHFYLLAKKKKVKLLRVDDNTNKKKAPDFFEADSEAYFEVKTVSVVSGNAGISKTIDDSFEARLATTERLNNGEKSVFSPPVVVQPYSDRPYQKGKGHLTAVIETLIEKCSQNIKLEQFPNNKSFLVLNLSLLPPLRTDARVLRPVYHDNTDIGKVVTGELWMMAFAQPGMLILSLPEFEGKPCVESISKKYGILNDTNFSKLAGVLVMVHPWNRPTEIWGLFDYEKHSSWRDKEPPLVKTLSFLTGINWNDSRDSNGWQLLDGEDRSMCQRLNEPATGVEERV